VRFLGNEKKISPPLNKKETKRGGRRPSFAPKKKSGKSLASPSMALRGEKKEQKKEKEKTRFYGGPVKKDPRERDRRMRPRTGKRKGRKNARAVTPMIFEKKGQSVCALARRLKPLKKKKRKKKKIRHLKDISKSEKKKPGSVSKKN